MARKTIALNTEPHVIEVGGVELLFQPEAHGVAFVDALGHIKTVQKAAAAGPDDTIPDPEVLKDAYVAMRNFLHGLMLPDSALQFLRWEVVAGGKGVSAHPSREEAEAAAAARKGAFVREEGMNLPMWAVVEMVSWAVETYGGNRPPTSSSGSAKASPQAGSRGTGTSRSKASTRTRGR